MLFAFVILMIQYRLAGNIITLLMIIVKDKKMSAFDLISYSC